MMRSAVNFRIEGQLFGAGHRDRSDDPSEDLNFLDRLPVEYSLDACKSKAKIVCCETYQSGLAAMRLSMPFEFDTADCTALELRIDCEDPPDDRDSAAVDLRDDLVLRA